MGYQRLWLSPVCMKHQLNLTVNDSSRIERLLTDCCEQNNDYKVSLIHKEWEKSLPTPTNQLEKGNCVIIFFLWLSMQEYCFLMSYYPSGRCCNEICQIRGDGGELVYCNWIIPYITNEAFLAPQKIWERHLNKSADLKDRNLHPITKSVLIVLSFP